MDITARNKQDLINEIIELEIGVQLEHDVMEVVKAMQHYKNVDKRFTDV